jgi:hypothetical protein
MIMESRLPMRTLFLTWNKENCSVHQYGKSVAAALGAFHQPISSLSDAEAAIARHEPEVVIWNWHHGTLGTIVHPTSKRSFSVASVCLLSEFDPHLIVGDFFDVFVMPDPTNEFRHPRFFTCGRAIVAQDNEQPHPAMPTIGTFGFGVGIKGYQRMIEIVRDCYATATLRLHIPANWAVDPEGMIARQFVAALRTKAGPEMTIEASHAWLDDDDLLRWLGKNTVNIFPYDPVAHPGISTSTDWALAARRPIAITNCGLFKHLRHLPICLESYTLREIVERGTSPLEHLWSEWSYENFAKRWLMICDAALDHAKNKAPDRAAPAPKRPATSMDATWRWRPEFAKSLRFPFQTANLLSENYSQSWQDLFVLTMLRGATNGRYLEIGANDPRSNSNTYVLSNFLNWNGVSIEYDPAHVKNWAKFRPDDTLLTADALAIDYEQAMPMWFGSDDHRIDYLQLDIEPSLHTLQVLKKLPLSTYRFSVITFETDVYTGDLRARDESRALLREHGYELVAADVGVLWEPISPHAIPFEDWWVDPAVVDSAVIASLHQSGGFPTLAQRLLFAEPAPKQ